MPAEVRQAREADFGAALALYAQLQPDNPPAAPETMYRHWQSLLGEPGTSVFCLVDSEHMLSMATLHLHANLTYGGRPYALVENVVTAESERGRGHAKRVMQHLIAFAREQGAYKIMLLTGRKRGASGFYERLGFDGDEKQAMILRNP